MDFLFQKEIAHWNALIILKELAEQPGKKVTKKKREEISNVLYENGISVCISPVKKGRKPDLEKRRIIKDFFVQAGTLPRIRNEKGRRNLDDLHYGLIAKCVKELKKATSVSVENARPLVAKILEEPGFRREVLAEIKQKQGTFSTIADVFEYYWQPST